MSNTYLVHHGILGQKWGVRRFQNEDGTLTAAGKRRTAAVEKRKTIVKKLSGKRDDIYSKIGPANSKYIKVCKSLLAAKGKLKISEGKLEGDATKIINGKQILDDVKILRKHDNMYYMGIKSKSLLYPSKLSSQEKSAIGFVEEQNYKKVELTNKITGPLKVAGIAAGVGLAGTIAYNKILSKGKMPLKNILNKDVIMSLGKGTVTVLLASMGIRLSKK